MLGAAARLLLSAGRKNDPATTQNLLVQGAGLLMYASSLTSIRQYAKKIKGGKEGKTGGSASSSREAPPEGFDPQAMFHQSRYQAMYRDIAYRELMLKSNPKKWSDVAELQAITLTIGLEDTRLEKTIAEKWELLLHLLALEHVGGRPATFIASPNKHYADKSVGVTCTLTGQPMWDFLEKLVYLVLPNQIGFEGGSQPRRENKYIPFHEFPTSIVDLKVSNLLLYPDFEQDFALFESLRGMQVRIEVQRASKSRMTAMLMSALALPLVPPVREEL